MFFDAKVLVLSRFEAAPNRSLARRRTIVACEGDGTLRIGRRVLREYLATVVRPQSRSAAISMADAPDRVASLETGFDILEDGTGSSSRICSRPCAGMRPWRESRFTTRMSRLAWIRA